MARHMARLDAMLEIFERITEESITLEPVFENYELFYDVEEFDDISLRIGWKTGVVTTTDEMGTTLYFSDIDYLIEHVIDWVSEAIEINSYESAL